MKIEFGDAAIEILYKNIVHRFCNMLSAETIRKFKRDRQLKKKAALRQGLQGQGKTKDTTYKSGPKYTFVPSIKSIIDEPVPKHSSHYSLKALAYKYTSVFTAYSHSELKFMMMSYGVGYSRANKVKQSERLASIIKEFTVMPNPEKLTNENYDIIKNSGPHSESTNAMEYESVEQSDTIQDSAGPTLQTTGTIVCIHLYV